MKSKGCKTIFFIFLICVICLSGAIGCNYLKHENIKKVKITKDKEKLSVNKNTEKKSELNGINNMVFLVKMHKMKGTVLEQIPLLL